MFFHASTLSFLPKSRKAARHGINEVCSLSAYSGAVVSALWVDFQFLGGEIRVTSTHAVAGTRADFYFPSGRPTSSWSRTLDFTRRYNCERERRKEVPDFPRALPLGLLACCTFLCWLLALFLALKNDQCAVDTKRLNSKAWVVRKNWLDGS